MRACGVRPFPRPITQALYPAPRTRLGTILIRRLLRASLCRQGPAWIGPNIILRKMLLKELAETIEVVAGSRAPAISRREIDSSRARSRRATGGSGWLRLLISAADAGLTRLRIYCVAGATTVVPPDVKMLGTAPVPRMMFRKP
jgi:hypothetical protein